MEPIRYLQPATFPPPALQHNSQEVYRKRKCNECSNESFSSERSNHNSTTTHCILKLSFVHRQKALMWNLILGIFVSLIQTIHMTPVFVDNPSLAHFQSGRNIRHLPCIVRRSGLSGTCMFAIDCIKNNGTHLGTCIDRFYFGSCCQMKDDNNLFAPEVNDNSIDQNLITNFMNKVTTLPTSVQYKPTTQIQQSTIISNNSSTSFKTSTNSNFNNTRKSSPTTTTTTTLHTTRRPPRPTNTITSSTSSSSSSSISNSGNSSIKRKRPTQNSTHQPPSQFVETTTRKPTATTTRKLITTRRTSIKSRTPTRKTTQKPLRRRPTTTLAPIFTTDGPDTPLSTIDDLFQTTKPPKFFTFQIVETTTPTMMEPTNFIDFTTMYPPTFHTKRPHRPSNHSKPSIENKTSAVNNKITTIEITTTKVRPSSPPIRRTNKPKTTTPATTLPIRKPSPTRKPSKKRPKPTRIKTTTTSTSKPVHTTLYVTTTERFTPIALSLTEKPTTFADETPPTTTIPNKQPSITTTQQVHTTSAPSKKPRPTASITKVPKPIITTTTTTTEKPPTTLSSTTTYKTSTTASSTTTKTTQKTPITTGSTTTTTTYKTPTTTSSTTFTTTYKTPTTTSNTTTTATTPATTPRPKLPTTLETTTTKSIEETIPSSTTPRTITTTFKPGLITWTNEESEPNPTAPEEWELSQLPSQWLPVSTIAPEISTSNKIEAVNTATTSTTEKPIATAPSGFTEKIIVSVATSISEAQRNDTIKPPKLTTRATTTSTTTTTPKTTTTTTLKTTTTTTPRATTTTTPITTTTTTPRATTTTTPKTTTTTPPKTTTTTTPRATTMTTPKTTTTTTPRATTTTTPRTTTTTTPRTTTTTTTTKTTTTPEPSTTKEPSTTTSDPSTTTSEPSTTTTTPKQKTTATPSISSKPTTPARPSLSTSRTPTTTTESTTIDYETSIETSTEGKWTTAATGSTTTVHGFTEDYNSTTIPSTATTLSPNSLESMDYRQICGRRMFPEPRIVGGSNSAFGRWPWQISLRQWRTSTYLHKCGAALLNENWAITAAHCVDNVPPSDLLLRLGEYDLAEEEEPYGYQERRVQIVASHPQFDPRTFEYDLALLRFYEPVIFQPNIIPVCVPNSDENFIGQTAFVTGWGRLYEDGPLPSVLQEVAVPVINNSICETMYRAAGYIEHIPHIFICAGWKKGGYDSCEGDSGGPMVIQREDDKRFQLGGVISWGIGCAEANQPGVYTRISEFRDWINQILQF